MPLIVDPTPVIAAPIGNKTAAAAARATATPAPKSVAAAAAAEEASTAATTVIAWPRLPTASTPHWMESRKAWSLSDARKPSAAASAPWSALACMLFAPAPVWASPVAINTSIVISSTVMAVIRVTLPRCSSNVSSSSTQNSEGRRAPMARSSMSPGLALPPQIAARTSHPGIALSR